MSFEGKIAWITGASSGLGEALARALAAQGATVILSARREEKLQAVRAACANPERHVVLPVDMADLTALETAAAQVKDRFQQVDYLVLNAGLSQRSLAVETQLSVDQYLLAVNYLAPVALAKQILPGMIARGSGHIVVISSLMGKFGAPTRSAYAASKHALHGFFDSLRAELAGTGIKVTMVCPGFIHTDASLNAMTATGERHGKMDATTRGGISPDACAREILRAVERGKAEIYPGGRETWVVYLQRFAPRLFRRLIAKYKFK